MFTVHSFLPFLSMAVKASDFPAGIASRVDLRIGCYILFAVTTVTFLLRYLDFCILHVLS